jgi:hypothetical protein
LEFDWADSAEADPYLSFGGGLCLLFLGITRATKRSKITRASIDQRQFPPLTFSNAPLGFVFWKAEYC